MANGYQAGDMATNVISDVLQAAQPSLQTALPPGRPLAHVGKRLLAPAPPCLPVWRGIWPVLLVGDQEPLVVQRMKSCSISAAFRSQRPLLAQISCSLSQQHSTVFLVTWPAAAALPTLEKCAAVCIRTGTWQGKGFV